MDILNVQFCLERLGLSETEAAELLSVDPRTVRRWIAKPDEMPGPAQQALKAWLRLDSLGLAWRPDGIDFYQANHLTPDQIAEHRNHAIHLNAVLEKVTARGGPALPWVVDLKRKRASLNGLQITFYALQNGGFSPQGYTRRDKTPDIRRDAEMIEDGYAAIADAIAKAGVRWAQQA